MALGVACRESSPKTGPQPLAPKPALTTSHRSFTNDEFATLEAAVDRMLPRDAEPGARELGVSEYVDRMLQTEQLAKLREDFPPGLAALDRRCQRLHRCSFATATPEQRDALLTLFKDSPETSGEARWYDMLLTLTMEGVLGDPCYGGNKGGAGWKLVGFNLVGRGLQGDPPPGYDGYRRLASIQRMSGS